MTNKDFAIIIHPIIKKIKDGIIMKKTVSLVLALMLAVVALFSISVMAFADEDAQAPAETPSSSAAPAVTEPTRPNERDDQATATTITTTTKSDVSAIIDKLTTVSTTKIPDKVTEDNDEVVTGKPAVNEENITKSTRPAANVQNNIPNTGSKAAVSAIAVLALMAGVATATVSTKKK